MDSPPISPLSRRPSYTLPLTEPRPLRTVSPDYFFPTSVDMPSRNPTTHSQVAADKNLYNPMDRNRRANQSRSFSNRSFSPKNSSEDSLYISIDDAGQPIKRWDGLRREATDWDSLRRDPELILPDGNCLINLYAAGVSRRGPSFRIPYHVLLHSHCGPLLRQCLHSTLNVYPNDLVQSTPLRDDSGRFSTSEEDGYRYLYLYPPAGLTRSESYLYHVTTRNFFAWLLGVPLVGTDPVSALLNLKVRMDAWRDPGMNNFEALFLYAKQQAYGDFEVIEVEMGKRLEADAKPRMMMFKPAQQTSFDENKDRPENDKFRRRDSVRNKLRKKNSRPNIPQQQKKSEHIAPAPAFPSHTGERVRSPGMTTFANIPSVPSAEEINKALQRLTGPPSTSSINSISSTKQREGKWRHWRTSSVTSPSAVSSMSPIEGDSAEAALRRVTMPSSTESVNLVSSSTATEAEKRKNRVSWADPSPTPAEKRASHTSLTFPSLQGIGLQSAQASSSAANLGRPAPLASNPPQLASIPAPNSSLPLFSPSAPVTEDSNSAKRRSMALSIKPPSIITVDGERKCTCCGKLRRPEEANEPPRPASVHSMKSSRSIKSWRSMKSWRSLSSFRSSFSKKSIKTGPATLGAIMKKRRQSFRARFRKTKPAPTVPYDSSRNVSIQSCNPDDYAAARPLSRKSFRTSTSSGSGIQTPAELHSDSMRLRNRTTPLATMVELDASNPTTPNRWSPAPHSYSSGPYSPQTPPEVYPIERIRAVEIYTSTDYNDRSGRRSRGANPRDGGTVPRLPEMFDQEHLDPNFSVVDAAFEDNIEALLGELEAAGIGERVVDDGSGSRRSGWDRKGKGKARTENWVSLTSSMGVPRLEVRGMA